MIRSLEGLRSEGKSRLISVCVFVVLAAVGMWGRATHWDFSGLTVGHPSLPAGAVQHVALRPVTAAQAARAKPAAPGREGVPGEIALGGEIRLSSPQVVEQMGIQLVAAESRSLCRELTVTARVAYESTRIAQLSSRVPGTVWRVEKHVGQWIRRGELLAVVDCVQVGKAKADLLHTLADLSLKERALARLKSLETGLVPLKQIELADVELRKARFEMFNVEQALINLGLPVDPEKIAGASDEDLIRYVKFLGLPDAIVNSLDPQNATANLLPLVAPFDGLVVGQDIARGERVATEENRFEIADVTHMLLRLDVREEDGEALRLGQHVIFATGNIEVTTSISWISTAVDPKTRTIEVRCDVTNPIARDDHGEPTGQFLLRANMFGTARVRVEERPAAIVVPTIAVQSCGKAHFVFVNTDATGFEAREVDVGIATGGMTELIHGLQLGERVASEGSHVLKSEVVRRQSPGGA
ncbi:MAG TPA: efflux RND transporter periplasmic adaptor subunit [Pirellulales bacterium]|jgi:cobalt-zinc-cadmium efflux system membrane fusion protein|nr:efflux RND transporter periplasmic adaptor subunit [Pirellulales bacterium]